MRWQALAPAPQEAKSVDRAVPRDSYGLRIFGRHARYLDSNERLHPGGLSKALPSGAAVAQTAGAEVIAPREELPRFRYGGQVYRASRDVRHSNPLQGIDRLREPKFPQNEDLALRSQRHAACLSGRNFLYHLATRRRQSVHALGENHLFGVNAVGVITVAQAPTVSISKGKKLSFLGCNKGVVKTGRRAPPANAVQRPLHPPVK